MGASSTKEEVYNFIKDIVDPDTAEMLLDCGLDGLTLSTSSEMEVTDAAMAIEDIAIRQKLLQVWRSQFPLQTKEMGDPSVEALFKGSICKLVLFKHWKHHFGK
jgi:hypothetical protein